MLLSAKINLMISVGFCVARHDLIQTFVPESFWAIDVTISTNAGGSALLLDWERQKLFDETAARIFLRLVGESEDNSLLCASVAVSQGRNARPQPMNTVGMLKMASKTLGIGPHACMRAAEHLYLSGFLSYPRTESSSYPSSYDFQDTLGLLRHHWHLGSYAAELSKNGFTPPRHGHDAGTICFYSYYSLKFYNYAIIALVMFRRPSANHSCWNSWKLRCSGGIR